MGAGQRSKPKKPESNAGRASWRHDAKVCGENADRLGEQVKPATAAIKSKSPGANPGFLST